MTTQNERAGGIVTSRFANVLSSQYELFDVQTDNLTSFKASETSKPLVLDLPFERKEASNRQSTPRSIQSGKQESDS
jgi:hypothetical protein